MTDSQRTGTRLLQALQSAGWSKRRLAQCLGCGEKTVARMCSGQDRQDINLLCSGMRAMGFSPSKLFDETRI